MSSSPHPLASSERAIRLREHTLVDVSDLLGAETFSLVDEDVTFTRAARSGQPVQRWQARIGDWCVSDDGRVWRLVADAETTVGGHVGEGVGLPTPDRLGTAAPTS